MNSPSTLPSDAPLLRRLRTAWQALEVLKDEPTNEGWALALNASLDHDVYVAMARQLRQTAEGRTLLDERPTLQGKDLDFARFEALPPGTLGHEFVRYFRDNKISPFETTFELRNDLDYIGKRYRETHDLFHVLTGYATDVIGEMELQAFVLGNIGIPSAAMILFFGTAGRLKEHGLKDLGAWLGRLRAAHRRGKQSRFLLSVPYERLWERQVSELSELLCAPRVTS